MNCLAHRLAMATIKMTCRIPEIVSFKPFVLSAVGWRSIGEGRFSSNVIILAKTLRAISMRKLANQTQRF